MEATLLLHGVYHGFPVVIDPDQTPDNIPPFEVDNYPGPNECNEALEALLEADLATALLRQPTATSHELLDSALAAASAADCTSRIL